MFCRALCVLKVLHDELQALQLEMISREERMAHLESENNRLLERWLKHMNEEAATINKKNENDMRVYARPNAATTSQTQRALRSRLILLGAGMLRSRNLAAIATGAGGPKTAADAVIDPGPDLAAAAARYRGRRPNALAQSRRTGWD